MKVQKKIASPSVQVSLAFLGTGAIFILFSAILEYNGQALLSSISLSLGISLVSVTAVETIWRAAGGGPVDKLLEQLAIAVPLLRTFKETGIDGFYPTRKQIAFSDFIDETKSAKEVDMMALSLRENWTSNKEFMEVLSRRVKSRECHYRILMLDFTSSVVNQRSIEEDDNAGRLPVTIKESLMKLGSVYAELKDTQRKFLEIRTVSRLTMYCSIIRIDNRMLVTFYMCSHRGSSCPTIAIQGKDSILFKKFSEEFEKHWLSGTMYSNQ